MNTTIDPNPGVLAKTLEEAGFESLWYGEHSHIPMSRATAYPPGGELPDPYKKMMDPYISLMTAAAATTRLKLGTGIALLLERDLFAQAKTISTLDRMSNGRVVIGCGVGWNKEEFENVSRLPWNRRYLALKETVAATRTLFTEPAPEFHGELIDFDPVWFEPKPLQEGGPRFLFGAMGPLGMKHAAQWADGWMPVDVVMQDVAAEVAAFRKLVSEQGRNPDDVEITMVAMGEITADLLKRYRDLGIHRVNVGVGVDNWDRPEVIPSLIEMCGKIAKDL
jgi:probable F420-dependent oxidoreductase